MIIYVGVLVVYLGILAAIGMVMSSRSRSAGDFALGYCFHPRGYRVKC